ncbi:MAG TPA: hypothetical protein VNS63_24820 [Blastocatellia bacterium]|nr:hypothetical protein [Blastocatellia bacterium]
MEFITDQGGLRIDVNRFGATWLEWLSKAQGDSNRLWCFAARLQIPTIAV